MIIFIIFLVGSAILAGLGYSLDMGFIERDEYIGNLLSTIAPTLAILGVILTLNENRRNLEESLDKAEQRHNESLDLARKQFITQMEKLERRNRIEDYQKYFEQIREFQNQENRREAEAGHLLKISILETGSIGLHETYSRSSIPKIDIKKVNQLLNSAVEYKESLEELFEEISKEKNSNDVRICTLTTVLTHIYLKSFSEIIEIHTRNTVTASKNNIDYLGIKTETLNDYGRALNIFNKVITCILRAAAMYETVEMADAGETLALMDKVIYVERKKIPFEKIEKSFREVDLSNVLKSK